MREKQDLKKVEMLTSNHAEVFVASEQLNDFCG